jgi:Ca-activated chloride channel homolog
MWFPAIGLLVGSACLLSGMAAAQDVRREPAPTPEAPASAAAQPPAVDQPAAAPQEDEVNLPEAPPIRVQVNEVIIPVTVTDDQGRFVTNLDQKDFRIFDEGREQNIRFFTRERNQPVVVGFLLDLSNSSRIHWKTFQNAAMELVWNLLPGDPKYSGYLVTYGNDAEVAVNTTQDSEKIVSRLRKLKPGGGASLYDAIWLSCTERDLVQGEPIEPRRILIVIGDGHDNASKRSLDEVLEVAQRNLVTIYGISTVAYGFNVEGERNLRRLAEETGGRVEYPLEGLFSDVSGYLSKPQDAGNYAYTVGTGAYAAAISKGIFDAVAAIAGEVTTQYILRYIPDGDDPGRAFRNIRVSVSLPNVKIRSRKGYYTLNP